ncbi:MAG TPA: histidine phosphatase family protein [Chthonomonadaceae bacterium]|nr:histidine phosphatase family protein [Chthonomonadaceae bacterium]
MADRVLYLIRHGRYDTAYAEDELGGSLTGIGRTQALLTARRLSALPIQAIHYSTLRRAAETADILAARFPGVEKHPSPLLWECVPCLPSLLPEIFSHISKDVLRQHERQARQAFKTFFQPVRDADRHEIIVSHGNLLRYFICRAKGLPPPSWNRTDIHECSISQVIISPKGRMTLVSYDEINHLPAHLRSYL